MLSAGNEQGCLAFLALYLEYNNDTLDLVHQEWYWLFPEFFNKYTYMLKKL
jgi:hypothetical protein